MIDPTLSLRRFLPLLLACCLLALSFLSPASARANCAALAPTLAGQHTTLTNVQQQRAILDNLRQGVIEDDFVLGDVLIGALDIPLEVLEARIKLNREMNQLAQTEPMQAPDAFAPCPEESKQWLAQARQIHSQQQIISRHLLHLYELPRPSRLPLVREATQWQTLHELSNEVSLWAEQQPEPDEARALNQAIQDWIHHWRSTTRIWLGQLVTSEQNSTSSNEVWQETLRVPDPQYAIEWRLGPAAAAPQLLAWLDTLEEAHRALIRESGKWRNQHIWEQGWLNFFQEMSHPQQFRQQLTTEIRTAPTNLVDAITRPFIRDYRRALQHDKRGEMLSSWFLQGLALVAIMSALLKLATITPQWLSQMQQRLLSTFEHKGLIQINSAILWFIKPNAPWFVVFVGANAIAKFLPSSWVILSWLAPVGSLYAAFRAVRVILEWLIARTYTRSGQFVSSHIANQQTQDAQRVSWLVLVALLSWILVKGTGGGYLMFFEIGLLALTVWATLFWMMRRHREPVARFLLYAAGKGTSKKMDPAPAQRWWLLPFWPLLYLLAHLADIIIHLHEKLLFFDTYRAASVKLLRMRIAAEAKEDELETEDNALPDESYTDWMQRNNKAWIDAIDLSGVRQPINAWNTDKSNDNVLLIVGDQGSGKTALVKRLASEWKDTSISILNIPAKTTQPEAVLPLIADHLCIPELGSVADLVKLDESLEPQIVVLDNTHNLFLSEVGCLDAYRALNECLNAHLKNVFWVVVMHAPSWTYLSCVFNRELRFSHVFKMPRWSPSDIRKLILSRHQGSRRRIHYNELLLSASAGSESSSVRAANSRVFNILWEQCSGNPQVAIHLWLAAARSKDNVVELGVPSKPAGTLLKELKDDLCFVYAAIVTHKSLTSEEIMRVTHFPEAIVRHALKQGVNMGLLWRDEQRRYRIQPSWQGTLASFLASKNLLWNN